MSTPTAPTPDAHTGCDIDGDHSHCGICGVGIRYGSRCTDHPMPGSSGSVGQPKKQATPDAADEREAGITPGGNPTCPKCGRWYGPGEAHVCADEREALVKVAAEAACRATHPTRWEYRATSTPCDACATGAPAVLDTVADRLVAPLNARLAEVEGHLAAARSFHTAEYRDRRAAEAGLAAAEQRALYAARDALYRGEGPDMFQDADIVYGEWLGNRADRLATQATNEEKP